VTSCHGLFGQASLDLLPGRSYESLVGVPASNPAAGRRGKVRVLPGHATVSFLSRSSTACSPTGEGARMPLVGLALPQGEIDLVDAWIDAGAPAPGVGARRRVSPRRSTYRPRHAAAAGRLPARARWADPGAREEQEGCPLDPGPHPTDLAVGKWKFS